MDSVLSCGLFLQESASKFENASLFSTCYLDQSSANPCIVVKELDVVSMISLQFWKTLYRTNTVFSDLVYKTVDAIPISNDIKKSYVDFFDVFNTQYRTFVKSYCDKSQPDEDEFQNTVSYLYKIFGKKRVDRIITEFQSDFSEQRKLRTIFVLEMKYLFYALAEVYTNDINDLLEEIQISNEPIRFLNAEESFQLKQNLQGKKTIDDLSNKDLDALFSILVPFLKIEDVFCNAVPKDKIASLDSGKTFYGLRHRTFTYEKMRRNSHSLLEWSCTAVKTLSDLEMPKGVVFRNENGGYCTVHEIIHGKGAYKTCLKQIGKQRKNSQNVILYRGTRVPPFATGAHHTLFEDMRKDLGSRGPIATFDETKNLLSDPKLGFIEDEKETVKAIGMSLGGNHSMQDAALHFGKISHVVPIASPGIDDETDQNFQKQLLESDFKIKIDHIWEYDDIVDQFGSRHMGAQLLPEKADVNIHLLCQNEEQSTREEVLDKARQYREFPKTSNFITNTAFALFKLQNAFQTAHCRKTTESSYRVITLNNSRDSDQINSILSHKGGISDPEWEVLRKTFAIDQWPLDAVLLPDFVLR